MCGEVGSCKEKFFKVEWGDAACCESPDTESSDDAVVVGQDKCYTKEIKQTNN